MKTKRITLILIMLLILVGHSNFLYAKGYQDKFWTVRRFKAFLESNTWDKDKLDKFVDNDDFKLDTYDFMQNYKVNSFEYDIYNTVTENGVDYIEIHAVIKYFKRDGSIERTFDNYVEFGITDDNIIKWSNFYTQFNQSSTVFNIGLYVFLGVVTFMLIKKLTDVFVGRDKTSR